MVKSRKIGDDDRRIYYDDRKFSVTPRFIRQNWLLLPTPPPVTGAGLVELRNTTVQMVGYILQKSAY